MCVSKRGPATAPDDNERGRIWISEDERAIG